MKKDKKIAVLFPGVGYTCDKPLLYYSARLAQQLGYVVVRVPYKDLRRDIKGDPAGMYQCFVSAREQAEDLLKGIDWEDYSDIVFFTKSVGTAVALSYAMDHGLSVKSVLFTPVLETFKFPAGKAIAFHGTEDTWADPAEMEQICEKKNVPLYTLSGANHSLECGIVKKDVKALRQVMKITAAFIEEE